MEEKNKKKKKLTLTVSSNKPFNVPQYTRSSQKKSVVIEKRHSRKKFEKKYSGKNFNEGVSKPNFSNKPSSPNIRLDRNFEIRKIAEERATKRFKGSKEEASQAKKKQFK